MTRRAEQDGVVALDLVAAVLRHHAAVLLVVLAAPVEAIDLEAEAAVALGQRLEHLDAGRDHFGADAVARNGGEPVDFHAVFPLVSGRHSMNFPGRPHLWFSRSFTPAIGHPMS